ncbi:hypothetical protein, partial [Alistipes finegoldii]|uniref:hypothetical protein n=1 Tax=Alistipes finegoldii TaxID=214856 RepID=UPI00321AAF78
KKAGRASRKSFFPTFSPASENACAPTRPRPPALARLQTGSFSPDTSSGDFFQAVRSAEKGQKRGAGPEILCAGVRFIALKLLRSEINRIFVR